MANRYARPIMFAMEPDVVFLFGRFTFGSSGAITKVANDSKGFCNATRVAISITGDITNSSATVSNVSSFAGLYVGMGISGTGIQAGSTILSMNAGAGSLVLSATATATTATLAITVAGGQYLFQLGSLAAVNLDVYNKLLGLNANWDLSGLPGAVSTAASTPAAPSMFLINNSVSIRTIPTTAASVLTDASFKVQFGTFSAGTFGAKDPASGEILRLALQLSRSSAQ